MPEYDAPLARPAVKLAIPEPSLVVLIGPSGSGKSTFARRHFKPTEVLSSDFCRGLVADDEGAQAATPDAFEVLHFIAAKRLAAGHLTVVDATNVQREARKPLVELARRFHCLAVAIVLNLPEELCVERNAGRPDRAFGPRVIRQQRQQLRRGIKRLGQEGFRYVYLLGSPEEAEAAIVERQPLRNDLRAEHGPFDIVGDIHGCYDELAALLTRLGYQVTEGPPCARHPEGRKAIFLGDLVDRGPKVPAVLRLVIGSVEAGCALCVPGNHDVKLVRKLQGRSVQITHGLAESLSQLEAEPQEFRERAVAFLSRLVSHYVLDDGRLVVAHAGMSAEMQGRASARVRDFALYGETTGETDEFGLPVRANWAADYRGRASVVYGHTATPEAEWLNRTINIDTGCVYGGSLTALRWPEKELVSVPAARVYCEPCRRFAAESLGGAALTAQQQSDDVLDIEDMLGKRIVSTRLRPSITVREEQATAALEVMSRFAANPKWLIYLPPTMSPCETSKEPGILERPAEAFAYYRHEGVPRLVCEEKHMGSRAIVVACRGRDAARRRFGVAEDEAGIVYTRTGRRFFSDPALEAELLARLQAALATAGLWEELRTDWVCLDCELMPWSAKAQELLRTQYAAAGSAARAALTEATATLRAAAQAGIEVATLLERYEARDKMVKRYVEAYRHYCWQVNSLSDLKLAPFHLLATEGAVHADKDHAWHIETLARLCQADGALLLATPFRLVDVTDPASEAEGVRWWEELTARGGEGMVAKPLDFVARGARGLVQPALKCRGAEYLRIIYGPEYDAPEHLERLQDRNLGVKRSLALREFALGIEALERFVRREPLRLIHECVFAILALESEPVDPRL